MPAPLPLAPMKHTVLIAILLAGLVLFSGARAELPPDAYAEMQAASPEALVIRVDKVEQKKTRSPYGTRLDIVAKAAVIDVKRTATGLKAGQTIEIRYTHFRHDQPIAGPSEPTIVQEGESYPAFLRKDDAKPAYGLAARGASFRKIGRE